MKLSQYAFEMTLFGGILTSFFLLLLVLTAGASCRFDTAQSAMLPPPAAIIPSEINLASYDSADYASNIDYQTLFLNASIAMAVSKSVGFAFALYFCSCLAVSLSRFSPSPRWVCTQQR